MDALATLGTIDSKGRYYPSSPVYAPTPDQTYTQTSLDSNTPVWSSPYVPNTMTVSASPKVFVPEHNTRHAHEAGPFCGPVAGLSDHSYPVDTSGRAHSALGHAGSADTHVGGNASDKIKQCACEQAEHQGWFQCHQTYIVDPGMSLAPVYPGGRKAF